MLEQENQYRRKVNELSLLFEVSQILDKSTELTKCARPILEALSSYLNLERGEITLLNRFTGEIQIEEAIALNPESFQDNVYQVGVGITGRVIKTGKPVIIPNVSQSTDFIHHNNKLREGVNLEKLSHICVPIKLENIAFGTLAADRYDPTTEELDSDVRILSIIASMIAQAIKLRQAILEEKQRLLDENARLHQELEEKFHPKNIIGKSRVMKELFDLMAQVSQSEASVIILGETGTGKELIAHAIHYNSPRAKKPFIKVNCAALPETVVESELFGHEKGSFTGAMQQRKGRFELADGGTIFLDEIGELSQSVQVKLLRVLQEQEFERVGGVSSVQVNVRVITATNRNLEEMVRQGEFREDLYYRLNVFPLHIPPLRERKSDIMLLADYFVEKYSHKNYKPIKRIASSAIDLLMMYHWPGNVRELENIIERSVLLSRDEVIHGYLFPPSLQSAESSNTGLDISLEEALENLEKELILDALKSSRGNMAKAARELDITERQIGLRVKKYNIEPKRY